MKGKYLFLFFILFPLINIAQDLSSTSTITLKEVNIEAMKISANKKQLPFSVSSLNFENKQKIFQQLSLQEYLEGVPGLFSLNSNNYAQDLRISIRGFGARSAFGIRGIKIVVDGIPETTPDGQGQLDNIPLGLIKNIEVIRGPFASLYGNAAGGVIFIKTLDSLGGKKNTFKSTLGTYNLKINQFSSFLSKKNTSALIYLNTTETNGFREHSALKQNILNLKSEHKFSNISRLNFQFNYTNSPLAQDSGGLTKEEAQLDKKQARQRNIDYDTFEKIDQFKFGLSYYRKLNQKIDFNAYSFFTNRDFYGKLPFENGGIIDLDRFYSGLGARFTIKKSNQKSSHNFQFGIESLFQNDFRKRYKNLMGIEGEKVFDQKEKFYNIAFYIIDEIKIDKWIIIPSLRFDDIRISTDKIGYDKNYSTFNPGLGFSYKLKKQQYLFMNFSSSFETPTLSEMSADPNDNQGFNMDLNPSKAYNYEIGWKLYRSNFLIEANAFYIKTNNEILPYELEAFPGRLFYNNIGATQRGGIEFFTKFNWKELKVEGSYNIAKYTFDNFENEIGVSKLNNLPGIPRRQLFLNFEYFFKNNWTSRLVYEYIGGFYANNSNSVFINSFAKTRLQISKSIDLFECKFEFYGGVNNILNQNYYDNIRLNAFGSRYFEPAPPRNFFLGSSIKF
tara:strand:+ start:760 stop:2778 length:2019 start_codon:yes stop_codon:yes gene_type:complete